MATRTASRIVRSAGACDACRDLPRNGTDLPLEIARSIYAARDYHVLWTHDFTGRRESGAIDNVGYSMVADAYLPALTAAVKRYDNAGVLPVVGSRDPQHLREDARAYSEPLPAEIAAAVDALAA